MDFDAVLFVWFLFTANLINVHENVRSRPSVMKRENANGWEVNRLMLMPELKPEGSIWCSIPFLASSIKTAISK